ncbi:hypothetical protein Nmel_008402 [Mimus melanotis]
MLGVAAPRMWLGSEGCASCFQHFCLPIQLPKSFGADFWLLGPKLQCGVAPPEQFCWSNLSYFAIQPCARRLQSLPESLMELLKDVDGELVGLTLSVLSKVLLDSTWPLLSPLLCSWLRRSRHSLTG